MRDVILAEPYGLLTTAYVARILAVTPRWVRWLARTKQLACDQTRSGVRLFRPGDVKAYMEQRAKQRARSRQERLVAVRSRTSQDVEPRQLNLFGVRLRLVRSGDGGERSLPHAEAKGPRLVKKIARVG